MQQPFSNNAVAAAFDGFAPPLRATLLEIRGLIFAQAARRDDVGPVLETLKWGQPAYLTPKTKSGSTIRLGTSKTAGFAALFVHCQTDLIAQFETLYGDEFEFEGQRAVLIRSNAPLDEMALSHMISLALTYHLNK